MGIAPLCPSYGAALLRWATRRMGSGRLPDAHQSRPQKNVPSTGDEAEAKRLAGIRPAR